MLFTLISFVAFSGCAQKGWEIDPNLGKSVNNAIRAQSIYPDGPPRDAVLGGLDGISANATIENYQKSFISRQAGAVTGGATGSSGAGGGSNSQAGTAGF